MKPFTPTSDLLFVYGSLRASIAHPMGEKLRREATLLGAAAVRGRLYRVSWYPGVTLSEVAQDIVHGELYRLSEPAGTLVWLDAYESITPGPTGVAQSDEYERRIVQVQAADGATLDAWMYLYRRDPTGLERVTSGQWIG